MYSFANCCPPTGQSSTPPLLVGASHYTSLTALHSSQLIIAVPEKQRSATMRASLLLAGLAAAAANAAYSSDIVAYWVDHLRPCQRNHHWGSAVNSFFLVCRRCRRSHLRS